MLNENDLLNKFKNEKDELGKLKKIESGIILGGCKLAPNMLDYRGKKKMVDGQEKRRKGVEKNIYLQLDGLDMVLKLKMFMKITHG